MSWEDMKTYWAWRGKPLEKEVDGKIVSYLPPMPTVKKLDYITINKDVQNFKHKLCIGVYDNDTYRPLHRDELESRTRQYTFDSTITGAMLVE